MYLFRKNMKIASFNPVKKSDGTPCAIIEMWPLPSWWFRAENADYFPLFLQVKKDDNRFHRTELLPGDRDNLAIQTRGGPEKHEVTGWVLVSSRSWQGSRCWNQTQQAWQRRPVHCPAGSTHTELLLHFQMQLRTAEVHGMFGNDQQIRTNFFPFTSKQNSLRPDPRIKYFNQVLINSYFTWPLIVVDTHCAVPRSYTHPIKVFLQLLCAPLQLLTSAMWTKVVGNISSASPSRPNPVVV